MKFDIKIFHIVSYLVSATSYVLGQMTGSFIGGYVSSGMGRVRTMAFFGVPVTLSSIGIAYASYPLTIHIWSFIQGLGDIVWMTTGSKFVAIFIAQGGW